MDLRTSLLDFKNCLRSIWHPTRSRRSKRLECKMESDTHSKISLMLRTRRRGRALSTVTRNLRSSSISRGLGGVFWPLRIRPWMVFRFQTRPKLSAPATTILFSASVSLLPGIQGEKIWMMLSDWPSIFWLLCSSYFSPLSDLLELIGSELNYKRNRSKKDIFLLN